MRRKMGRVTDTEWLASNLEYARAMIQLCAEQPDAELRQWAQRLSQLWAATRAAATPPAALPPSAPPPAARIDVSARYIGRLR